MRVWSKVELCKKIGMPSQTLNILRRLLDGGFEADCAARGRTRELQLQLPWLTLGATPADEDDNSTVDERRCLCGIREWQLSPTSLAIGRPERRVGCRREEVAGEGKRVADRCRD